MPQNVLLTSGTLGVCAYIECLKFVKAEVKVSNVLLWGDHLKWRTETLPYFSDQILN